MIRIQALPLSSASECSSAYAKSMPASLPPGLLGIILNANHNGKWSYSSQDLHPSDALPVGMNLNYGFVFCSPLTTHYSSQNNLNLERL